MGGKALENEKYVIEAVLRAEGKVERPDIVGAIFGQTEGLMDGMELRKLQETGRIGRIQVDVKDNLKEASITLPTMLDAEKTCMVGAALETVERAGSSPVRIEVRSIEDRRTRKREYIKERASELMEELQRSEKPETPVTEFKRGDITTFHGFEAGPEAEESDRIILVEGRADLRRLMESGIENAVAVGGTNVPREIEELEEKEIVAFLDGDRSAELLEKELQGSLSIDKVFNAPENTEVEDMEPVKIRKTLDKA